MSKILLWSDIHIHAHKKSTDRLHDCLKVLEWVFQTAVSRNITNIIFAGDLFQDRQKIDVMTYALTFKVFSKYCNNNFKIYLLLGNHDLWYYDKWDISSVQPFSALPGITLIDKDCSIDINGEKIDFLPYLHDPVDSLSKLKFNKNKILVGHLACHGAKLNTLYNTYSDVVIEHDAEMVKIDVNLFLDWEQVFLGHYHNQQRLGNVEYIGSPLQLTFGEAFQHKHIIIYDTKTKEKEYIRNNFSPQHFIIPYEDLAKYDLEDNFLRVSVKNHSTNSLIEIKKEIEQFCPRTLEIIPIVKETESQIIEDAKAILQREDEMLEKYVQQVEAKDLDAKRLIEIGKKICHIT
jgi:DNA repair exonuclease SbcCD nuclease subunit